MQDKENIESLFREAFKNFEEPVRPELWTKVSEAIKSAPSGADPGSASGSSVSGGAGLAGKLGLYIAGAVLTVGTITAIYFYNNKSASTVTQNEPAGIEMTRPDAETVQSADNQSTGAGTETGIVEPQTSNPEVNTGQRVSGDSPNNSYSSESQSTTENTDPLNSNTNSPVQAVTDQTENLPAETPVKSGQPSVSTQQPVQQPAPVTEPAPVVSETEPVRITASIREGVAPLAVSFNAESYTGQVSWNFGDGTSPKSQSSTSHTFQNPGNYTVTFNATDLQGKPVTKEVSIRVLADLQVRDVPNVFTPNGDGLNDTFTFDASHLTDYEVKIYDQNGRMVASWKKPEEGWDGKLNSGEDAKAGTYFYVIFATGQNGQKDQQKGIVKLIRNNN